MDGSSFSVQNGTDGTDGTNGTNGTDGSNGTSCTVTDNGDGTKDIACDDGTSVTVHDGTPGVDGGNFQIDNFHGAAALDAWNLAAGMYLANVEVSSVSADPAGVVTVDNADGQPVLNVPSASVNIVKLVPAATGEASNHWVPYVVRKKTVSGSATGNWPNPDGTTAYQAYKETNTTTPGGLLVNNHDGSYTYTMMTNLATATVDGTTTGALVGYDRTATHRVAVMIGGHAGPTGSAWLDFRPDGAAVTETRNVVVTAACKACHGEEFAGHGGDRRDLEVCVTCHLAGNTDPRGGESLDM